MLGKAVPGDDDTASLLVQLNRIAAGAGVEFSDLRAGAAKAPKKLRRRHAPKHRPAARRRRRRPRSPPRRCRSARTIGPAGLAVMPYNSPSTGDFFEIADFIKGLDSLVKTEQRKGRGRPGAC